MEYLADLFSQNQLAAAGITTTLVASLLVAMRKLPEGIINFIFDRTIISVEINSIGPYLRMSRFIIDACKPIWHRSFMVSDSSDCDELVAGNGYSLYYHPSFGYFVVYHDYRASEMGGSDQPIRVLRLYSFWGKRKLQDFVKNAYESDSAPPPDKMWVLIRDGDDYKRRYIPHITMPPVLANGLWEDILDDAKTFLNSKDLYRRRGIHYHRGVILSGPPGTGKTSVVRAVASALGLPLFISSVTTLKRSDDLSLMFLNVSTYEQWDKSGAIVVIEDIDALSTSHSRDDADYNDYDDDGIKLDNLLNLLDGILTPENVIFYLTTNHPDKLDQALMRPGRCDRHIELSYCTADQIIRLAKRFDVNVPTHIAQILSATNITPAHVQEHLIKGTLLDAAYDVKLLDVS